MCETGHGGARLSSQHLGSEGRSIISSKLSLFSSELHGESGASLGISETISQIKQKQKNLTLSLKHCATRDQDPTSSLAGFPNGEGEPSSLWVGPAERVPW